MLAGAFDCFPVFDSSQIFNNKFFTLLGKIFFSLPISDILYTYVMGETKKVTDLNLKKKD